jgi:hypothetical protein
MQVFGGVRQRPPTDFIHCEVAQGRESPGAGDLCQLRLTPVPLGEFTGLLLRDKLAGFYCGVFLLHAGFYSPHGNFEAPASAGSRPGAQTRGS